MTAAETRPIILTATFGPGDNGLLQELRQRHFPPERNLVPAHLTLFHHLAPSLESEVSRRVAELARGPAPRAELAGVMDLGRGTAIRVVSPDLEAIRAELAEAFRGMLTPQDQAGWRPHVTIQNKVERAEAKALQGQLADSFAPRPLAVRGLAAWHYAGGPWEPIRDWSFRGRYSS